MEKKDHNPKDNKPKIGLMEYVRLQQNVTEDIDMLTALSRPWIPPNTDKIYCGTDLADKLQGLLNL
jgi:hypothetical protein